VLGPGAVAGGAADGGRDLGDLVRAGAGGAALDGLAAIATNRAPSSAGDAGFVPQQEER
jgi:hypothetical protein